jgi:hypothetical protein
LAMCSQAIAPIASPRHSLPLEHLLQWRLVKLGASKRWVPPRAFS